MIRHLTHALIAPLVTAFFVVLGVASAQQMAPDSTVIEQQVLLQALGATPEELCGTDGVLHDHHCPVCNTLPEVRQAAPVKAEIQMAFSLAGPTGYDLVVGPQHILPHVSLRAPPRRA